ncbi:MAG: glutathione S-transferase family protein [Caldimonas sp.]
MQLYIGNKNYSSWSMRPWLLMTERGIAFEEVKLRLDGDDGSLFKTTLHALAPTGRVPLLVDDGFAIWDTLAIAEYLAERFPEKALWPADARQRARARSICAEMHAGFGDLRTAFPMNIEASLHEIGARMLAERPGAARDLARIDALWSEQLEASGGPFLFGDFGIADAYFAPVCSRITSYALPVSPGSAAYLRRMRALPSFARWTADALAEHDFLVADEPYRTR